MDAGVPTARLDALASQRRPCRRLHSRYVERIDFDNLDATGFEEFCFELLRELPGSSNVDWWKGTGWARVGPTGAGTCSPRSHGATSMDGTHGDLVCG